MLNTKQIEQLSGIQCQLCLTPFIAVSFIEGMNDYHCETCEGSCTGSCRGSCEYDCGTYCDNSCEDGMC